ncbi:phytoene/squalene synthase family protein [Jatrophihabitans sp. GAS493]|uniref:phytoene/squalene synthase family protein n=1 Tax=Jatrophihabitans sp. GAS493 TaxID=1907575 RepID=UPI001A7E0636|nr:phytoene/squalene synthase family protein [Jatrophihabitans sp. GAS493]
MSVPIERAGFEEARHLNASHGRTFYLATLLLPAAKRPYVHALYGFARYADDIVDELPPQVAAPRFARWSSTVLRELEWGDSSDPLVRALIVTIARWQIPLSYFADFLESMRNDLTVTRYADYDELSDYMWGSAAVIGLQMLPILGRADSGQRWDVIEPFAIDLGLAFQLTNFIRDVGDDLDRGRIYLPQESLQLFGVDTERLRRRQVDEPIRNLLAHEIARARALYLRAQPGIELLHPSSQDCLRTAYTLYSEILDQIERVDYDVFSSRVAVGLPRRARVAVPAAAHVLRRARPRWQEL